MAVNSALLVGGQSAGGVSGGDLSWFAPAGTAGPAAVSYTAEQQTITESGTPTGGTFTLTWRGLTTAGIAYNAASSAVASAINAAFATYFYGATATVSGSASGPYTVTFPQYLGNVSLMTVNSTGLTGGTSPSIAIAESVPGVGANPATASIPAGFKSTGWMDTTLTIKTADTTKNVDAFGATSPPRTFFSAQIETFDLKFLESRPICFEIYHRLPFGSVTVDPDGYVRNVFDGPPVTVQYSGIFDVVDGDNRFRAYAPFVQNTAKGDMAIPFGDVIGRSATLTAYPDSNGVSVYYHPVVKGLIGMTGI